MSGLHLELLIGFAVVAAAYAAAADAYVRGSDDDMLSGTDIASHVDEGEYAARHPQKPIAARWSSRVRA